MAVAPLVGLLTSAWGMNALSAADGPSLVGSAMSLPVPRVSVTSGTAAEGCVMVYSTAFIAFLLCCRAVP